MSRDIKFRAWGKNSKEYLGSSSDGFNMEELSRLAGQFKNWELEQYTGLTDKNGGEIYEGDIIEDTRGNFWVCHWSDTCSGWSFRQKFMSEDDFMASDDISQDWLERSEVIGNIHENPELLEG